MLLRSNHLYVFQQKQSGAALILIIFLIGIAVTSTLISSIPSNFFQSNKLKQQQQILANSKDALIGYTLNRVSSGERPGNLPLPDYFASSESPANYDGDSDGCMDVSQPSGLPLITNGINMRCLGRLPWKILGLSITKPTENDTNGYMPWYALSANLVDPTCLSNLNPNTLNMSYSSYICNSNSQLPHPWLTIRDEKGNVISNRVAFILFYPNNPTPAQTRQSNPLDNISNYLDTITVPVGCSSPCVPGTYSNNDLDNDFIIPSGQVNPYDKNDLNYANDKVIFITIDDFINHITARAAAEAKSKLNGYNNHTGQFPYPANLGSAANNYISNISNFSGMLPIDGTDNCSCSSATSCSCSFQLIDSVAHTRTTAGNYTSNSGLCTRSARSCTCTGAGQCIRGSLFAPTIRFTCNSSGLCDFIGTGASPKFTFTAKTSHAKISLASSACSIVSGSNSLKADCNGVGSFWLGLNLPEWFTDNLWQEFFFYQRYDGANFLTSGTSTNIQALLIGTGAPIIAAPYAENQRSLNNPPASAQFRPSTDINDYLDSIENTDNNLIFEASNQFKSPNFNDQVFKVAP